MLVRRFLVLLGLVLAGAAPVRADRLPGCGNLVPVGGSEEVRDVAAENCAEKLLKEQARRGQLVPNANTGHGEEYERLYRACIQESQRLRP